MLNVKRHYKKIKKEVLDFNAVFLEEEDGGYGVYVPSLPGCFSQGNTFEEASENIKEAILLYLEEDKKQAIYYHPKREFVVPIKIHG